MPLFNPVADIKIGSIQLWMTGTPPENYLLLDGTAVSRTTYESLFSLWGTTFGVGDGSTTFNLPDARGRFPLGKAASGTGSTLGGTGGSIDHTHTVDITSTTSGAPSSTSIVTTVVLPTTSVASSTHTHSTDPVSTASSTNNPPFMVYNFIVRAL